MLDMIFNQGVSLQMQAFKKGFNSILPIEGLRSFEYLELEELICGESVNPAEWNEQNLLKNFKPDHGFDSSNKHYRNFIKYLTNLDENGQKAFVRWLTGARRLPMGGLGALTPLPTINQKKNFGGASQDEALPSVMTCQNYVKLPEYSSYEVLKAKFDRATKERFFGLS